jgi:hypothetical protein
MRLHRSFALFALVLPACTSSLGAPGEPSSSSSSSSGGGACTPGATEACYTGPASTRDVGACHAGVRTCAADGHGFGACEGEVVPQPESCGSQTDVDCDGKTGCTGDALWKLPLTGTIQMGGVTASDDGEIAIFGWAQSIDIGTGAQGDGSTWSLFAAGIHAGGTPAWLHTFPGVDASTRAGAIVMDAQHRATLVVYAEGSTVIQGQTIDASPDGVLAVQLDPSGSVDAAALVNLNGPTGAVAPWVDVARLQPDGSVIVGGAGFLAQLGAGVTTTWHRRYASDVTFADLAFATDGTLIATGSYEGTFAPGGGATPVSGNHAGFVAQIDAEHVIWSETLGGDVETSALSVVALPDYYGVLAVGGLQAGGGDLVSGLGVTGMTGFLAQRDMDGAVASTFFGWGPASPAMTVDAAGDTVVRLVMPGQDDWHFLLKTSADGELGKTMYWVQQFQWPPVSFTLPTGETIVATKAGVQELDR